MNDGFCPSLLSLPLVSLSLLSVSQDDDDDDEGPSVAAIKSSFRSRLSEMRGGRRGGGWGGAESAGESSEEEEEGAERLMRAKTDSVETALSRKRHLEPPEGE